MIKQEPNPLPEPCHVSPPTQISALSGEHMTSAPPSNTTDNLAQTEPSTVPHIKVEPKDLNQFLSVHT
ncbi:hypothetical protein chiPu_0024655, partial [Chiloscyllium punctatum]|nr:hypothetical protein [Chiloscyllium punctatum]